VVAASDDVQSLIRPVFLEQGVYAACIAILMTLRRPAAIESWKASLALTARRIVAVRPTLKTLAGTRTAVPLQKEAGILRGAVTTLQPSPTMAVRKGSLPQDHMVLARERSATQAILCQAAQCSLRPRLAILRGLNHSEKRSLIREDP